jgi:hypothetical protein
MNSKVLPKKIDEHIIFTKNMNSSIIQTRISPDLRKPAMIASSTAIENALESFVN